MKVEVTLNMDDVCISAAGERGSGAQGVRGNGERKRRSKRSSTGGTECRPDPDYLPGVSSTLRELPLHAAKVQVLSVQLPEARDTRCAAGYGSGRGTEGTRADGAARRQGAWGRRRRPQWCKGQGRRMVRGSARSLRGRKVRTQQDSRMIEHGSNARMSHCRENKRENGRRKCEMQHEQNARRQICEISCGIDSVSQCEVQHEQNALKQICEISCGIDSALQDDNKRNASQDKDRRPRIMGNVGDNVMLLLAVFFGMCIGRNYLVRFTRMVMEDTCNPQGEREHRKYNRTSRDRKKLLQRRSTHRRIRKWRTACRKKYDGKDRTKYRHKVRASKRWLRTRSLKEAWKANIREHKKHVRRPRDKDMKRRGGAGGRRAAKMVNASDIEKEILNDVGVPQQTWGDGSCWIWAVAGALNKIEGREYPTEKDLQLEKEWRNAIQDIVHTHGIPMSEEDLQGLREG
eukprot:4404570-Pleurochrysis_carterae.AAC.1